MGTNITQEILCLKGQRVKQVIQEESTSRVIITCDRDRRMKAVDPLTGQTGTINRYVRRQVRDLPLFGCECFIEIELAQVRIGRDERRIEQYDWIDKGSRYTRRFCQLASGLCRHMSIQAVYRHLGLRWETVKNMDKSYLLKTLPALVPEELEGLEYIINGEHKWCRRD